MKTFEKIFFKGCAYSSLISCLFFIFASVSNFTDAKIGFLQFLLFLILGIAISAANYIFEIKNLNAFLKLLIHYFVLFTAFTVIFVLNGNISKKGAGAIFSSFVIFTFFYAIVFLVVYLIKKSYNAIEKKIPESKTKNKSKAENYTPRFK